MVITSHINLSLGFDPAAQQVTLQIHSTFGEDFRLTLYVGLSVKFNIHFEPSWL
jgi:hypothetical protein